MRGRRSSLTVTTFFMAHPVFGRSELLTLLAWNYYKADPLLHGPGKTPTGPYFYRAFTESTKLKLSAVTVVISACRRVGSLPGSFLGLEAPVFRGFPRLRREPRSVLIGPAKLSDATH